MGDLISRRALLAEYDRLHVGEPGRARKMIEDAPSVQPEIIHCKDCKYYIPYDWMFDGLTRSSNRDDYASDEIGCSINDHNYPPDGFCCFAERRTDE